MAETAVRQGTQAPLSPSPARMVRRGLVRRCAACGGGGLFTGWFRMRDRCPRCGYVFAREDGFALGAILMNLAVTELLLAVLGIVPLIAVLAANPDANVVPVIVGSFAAVLVGPIAFYPFSRTLWVALELVFRPATAAEPHDRH
ncbi:MAG: DUF983 domain-containing protein [Acidimicrobiales bacterium]